MRKSARQTLPSAIEKGLSIGVVLYGDVKTPVISSYVHVESDKLLHAVCKLGNRVITRQSLNEKKKKTNKQKKQICDLSIVVADH